MKGRQVKSLKIIMRLGVLPNHVTTILLYVLILTVIEYRPIAPAPGRSNQKYFSRTSDNLSKNKNQSTRNSSISMSIPTQPDAIDKLSKVFGFSRIPYKNHHRSPPQYMQELYTSITDAGGLSKTSGPYNSNVIRSFPDKDSVHRMHFHYNISYLERDEHILQAEFRLFKMKPKASPVHEIKPPHVILIKIYEVLDIRDMVSSKNLRLLDVQRISTHRHGWYVFNVTPAVLHWNSDPKLNFGLLVTTQSTSGTHVNGSYIRFAQRNEHHDSKQPVLVIFTDDGRPKHPTYISPMDEGYHEIKRDALRADRKMSNKKKPLKEAIRMLNERARRRDPKANKSRSKRSASKNKKKGRNGKRRKRTYDMYRYRRNRRSCTRYEMFVDFEEIGWSGWIISPNSYNAYHCSGECPFPLGQSQKPTNHATVQSIVHALGVGKNVGTPCCVPNKLYSISLLYFDDNENVILKQYDDMVVASCGCH